MSSSFGDRLRVSIFGQSHGAAIGVVMDGLPAGETIDLETLQAFLRRRAPKTDGTTTARRETDEAEILSGLADGHTTGDPLAAIIRNRDAKSEHYQAFANTPRPSHADYPARLRFGEGCDLRGGGHFSGRLTAPLCFAGGIAAQLLARRGVTVGAHIKRIFDIEDISFDPVNIDAATLRGISEKDFPCISDAIAERMRERILTARQEGDSLGGLIECAAVGFPAGKGNPMFNGLENRLSAALFGIPALRGVEFGAGFAAAAMRGSTHNDPYCMRDGAVRTITNHHGGILGGISTGMPVLLRVAIKPTPSIALAQETVDLQTGQPATLRIEGRHDPCIVPRALPCVEAVVALCLLDYLL